jgi:hypothetical protein
MKTIVQYNDILYQVIGLRIPILITVKKEDRWHIYKSNILSQKHHLSCNTPESKTDSMDSGKQIGVSFRLNHH